jgi:hypothetical protein
MQRRRLAVVALLGSFLFAVPAIHLVSPAVQAGQGKTQNEVTVWVNTASSVYHCPGTRWYGSTKRGKYLGECAAIKDGNRPAYGKACGSDCQSALIREPASSPTDKENTAPTTNPQAGRPDVKVWVNTNSGVYHCPGTRWYGSTKQGEFMTQKKAQDGGNRPAYGKVCE